MEEYWLLPLNIHCLSSLRFMLICLCEALLKSSWSLSVWLRSRLELRKRLEMETESESENCAAGGRSSKEKWVWEEKRLELGTDWDKVEAHGGDEGWGCQGHGRAAKGGSDIVVTGGKKRKSRGIMDEYSRIALAQEVACVSLWRRGLVWCLHMYISLLHICKLTWSFFLACISHVTTLDQSYFFV